ncbi:MAG: SGNH/GDSL hydrolase family protein [Rhizomicrobium sp.]
MSWTKQELKTVALRTGVLFLTTLIVFEVAMGLLRPSPDEHDAVLGWKLKQDYHRVFTQRTLDGQRYLADFWTNAEGFRTFGTNDQASIRILVLGDSFTADPYGANDQMWYGKMAERLAAHLHRPASDIYVLAGGAGGWGTYQELLLSRQIARKVKPNLFVLQFCSNDFLNNSLEWESQSTNRSQWMRRPFMNPRTGRSEFAHGVMPALYRTFLGETRLFTRIDGVIAGMQFKMYGGYVRPLSAEEEAKYERDSVAVTERLLAMLRQEYARTPAVAVNCDGDETGPNAQWKSLARRAGFVPIGGPSDFLRSAKLHHRRDVFNEDGAHLSNVGDQLYGTIAGDELASLGLVR